MADDLDDLDVCDIRFGGRFGVHHPGFLSRQLAGAKAGCQAVCGGTERDGHAKHRQIHRGFWEPCNTVHTYLPT